MTVQEMIEWLRSMPADAEVRAWDPDAEEPLPVTGAVFDENVVELQTDPEP